ncbi:MAG: CcmD family protein [Caldilineaceae bacterium]|nr:CcmD family protein [Caldilineaceae bacterium]
MVYLAAAFIVLWLSVVLFVAFMLVRQRKLEQELEMLEEQVSEGQGRTRAKRA